MDAITVVGIDVSKARLDLHGQADGEDAVPMKRGGQGIAAPT
jgi:hypothetical protein